MFPLAGLVCRTLMRARGASRRWFLRCCGEAPAPSCCRWFLSRFRHGSRPITSGATSPECEEGEGEGEWRRQGWGKECLAVLTGLCAGGHLDSARRAATCDSPWGTTTTTSSGGGRRFVFYPLPTCYHKYDNAGGDFTVGRLESEFWGEKGLLKLLDVVAKRGHLDTLKWALSRFGGTDESWFLLRRFLAAVKGFQVDTVVWLANTINSTERLALQRRFWPWGVPHSASDIPRLIEAFPNWPFDARTMAQMAVDCKGPSDEIIKVCEWLVKRFPSEKMDFTDSRNCEVVKWALEGVNSSRLKGSLWGLLWNADDVQFAQWLLERVIPTEFDLNVCRHRKDNVAIVKLVCEKLPLSSEDILDALHMSLAQGNTRIAQFLEERFFNLTKTTPTLSLNHLLEYNHVLGTAFPWQHAGIVDAPESEVVGALNDIITLGSRYDPTTMHMALFLIEKFRPALGEWFSSKFLKEAIENGGDLLQVKKIVHLAEAQVGGLVPSDVLRLLTHYADSSKVLKWLISHFNLEKEMSSKQKGKILISLISRNKCSCAQWFAHKFSVTANDVFHLRRFDPVGADFAGWSLMLTLFPAITQQAVIDHFLETVAHSPLLLLWPDIMSTEQYLAAANSEETIWWLEDQGLSKPTTTTTPDTPDLEYVDLGGYGLFD
ncbi:hypothetical protein Pelo_9130 [Pelomyxa schiedti]|nr:hypothetical protein Pelo_9130 [Pelomyxa schiedti]